jgi:two-component system phosphate regulon response regulator PhoB
MPPKILVVDDEKDIVEILGHVFRREGWNVVSAYDGKSALDAVRKDRPDLVILDLMLPEIQGLEVLKLLKSAEETRAVPVLLLTAKGEEIDRVLGFEFGADDYVTKPFSAREVVLRVRAVLKRSGSVEEAPETRVLRFGPIELDLDTHRATVQKEPVALTITEFRLLADLVRARGRVRSREALLSEVWGYDSDVLSRTVDTHMRRLRSKLGPAAQWLGTVRGVGYRIEDPARE